MIELASVEEAQLTHDWKKGASLSFFARQTTVVFTYPLERTNRSRLNHLDCLGFVLKNLRRDQSPALAVVHGLPTG